MTALLARLLIVLACIVAAASAPRSAPEPTASLPSGDLFPAEASTSVPGPIGAPEPGGTATSSGSTPLLRSARPTSAPSPSGASGSTVVVTHPPRPSTRPTARPSSRDGRSVRRQSQIAGIATWYCLPGRSACTAGYPADECHAPAWRCFAAAGEPLRRAIGPGWRGSTVTVCTPDCIEPRATVDVRLIDECVCGRVLDLYASAFAGLAALSAGELAVEVSW